MYAAMKGWMAVLCLQWSFSLQQHELSSQAAMLYSALAKQLERDLDNDR